ncbi:MAG TPA: hypothetical protein VHX13_02430 [Acidobacteriaceae bacterium]|jgi:multisubunit Na+/H+ antiporter MnhG subunit|nr:hypothetical protein [Acidobacteriaceae bacterium]
MSLDLRTPLGLLFSIVGAMLTIFGLITRGSSIYDRSAGLDINLIWGLVMLVFGLTMFFLGRYSKKQPQPPSHEPAERPRPLGH